MDSTAIKKSSNENFCKISITDSDIWVYGIISSLNNRKNIINIFLTNNHLKSTFKIGDKVTIKSIDNSNELFYSGIVYKKYNSIFRNALVVKFDEAKQYTNIRKYERFHVHYPASINPDSEDSSQAIVADVSLGGTLLTSKKAYKNDELIKIEIAISQNKSIRFTGKIMYVGPKNNNYNYGIQISDIDDENRKSLVELTEFLSIEKQHIAHIHKLLQRIRYAAFAFILIYFFFFFMILETK